MEKAGIAVKISQAHGRPIRDKASVCYHFIGLVMGVDAAVPERRQLYLGRISIHVAIVISLSPDIYRA